jgi:hypothetical protein
MRKIYLIVIFATICCVGSAFGDEIPSNIDAMNSNMLSAIKGGDYDRFVADGDIELRGNFSKLAFRGICLSFGSRLATGYQLTYWGTLNRRNQVTAYVWKVTFQDGGGDSLWQLAIKNAKVFSFLIQ